MSDFLIQQVFNDSRLQVMVPGERMVVTVLSGDTVYYGDRRVSSTQNLGSLTVGQSITVTTAPTWLISASISNVSLLGTPTAGGGSAGGGSATSTVLALGSVTGAVSCDLSQGTVFTATVTGNATFTFTNWPAGAVETAPELYVVQDGAGGHSITIAGVTWLPSGTPPAFNTAASQLNYIPLSSPDGGAHVYGMTGSAGTAVTTRSVSGATALPASAAGGSFVDTLTGDTTYGAPTGASSAAECVVDIKITQDGVGAHAVTWPGVVLWVNGVPPAVPQGAGQTLLVTLVSFDGGVSWQGSGGAPVGGAIARTKFNPGTVSQYNAPSGVGSIADLDAPNLSITFTAPGSGAVIVRLNAGCYAGDATSAVYWALREASTTIDYVLATLSPQSFRVAADFLIIGLVPGSVHTYKWAQWHGGAGLGATAAGGGTAGYGAAVMIVLAA